ncbi:histidine kinase [Mycobacterium sp. GA-1285]|uniref:GAF domain-containing protein n=1 Tax=Mycobacterium sp. GA-1285 TaxID=1772282 RepID=UPI000746F89F|nr:GAF domain-containing protein [Mycobacterium sp. GA-1285]KUI16778.1 histidine kinase [Mycobacterium sp. GA-1285]
MTRSFRRFDEWLNRRLEECARNAGTDVDTYVARAVGVQMVCDQMRTKLSAKELLTHLSETGVLDSDSMPDVSAVTTDPDRLSSLHSTGLLDSPPEPVYDRITLAAAEALDTPFAAVTLVDADRTFYKSTAGMGNLSIEERAMPFDQSICQYTVADGAALVIEDARTDPVFMNHPMVRGGALAAYLGIPLVDHAGHAIGTLCVSDSKPRQWSTGHVQILSDLAQLVVERIFAPHPTSSA